MNQEQLAEIRVRCEAATPGPWIMTGSKLRPGIATSYIDDGLRHAIITGSGICKANDNRIANAVFLAHAREDIPALLAEIERLRGETLLREDEFPYHCHINISGTSWDGISRLLTLVEHHFRDGNLENGDGGNKDSRFTVRLFEIIREPQSSDPESNAPPSA